MSLNQIETYPAENSRLPQAKLASPSGSWLVVIAWGMVICAIGVALGPLLIAYVRQLWGTEHYQFVPVLFLAACWLTWRRWKSLPADRTLPHSIALRLLGWGGALLLTIAAVAGISPLLSFIALLSLAIIGLYEWRGAAGLRHFLPVLGVLLLAVRPPFKWDQAMILAMQGVAAEWASGVLDLMGVRHMISGVVIRLPEQEFFVAEACSGVHSLFATLAFIAVYSAVTHRGFPRVVCLLIAGIFWVLVANILRILAVVVLSSRYHLPVVDGAGHELLGIAVFVIVISMVLSADRLLMYIVPPRQAMPELIKPEFRQTTAVRLEPSGHGRAILAFGVAACFVLMVSASRMLPAGQTAIGPLFAPVQGLVEVPGDALPTRWDGWEKVAFEFRENDHDLQGEFSRIWNFRKGRLQVAVSIDGPFEEWHDTEYCYRGLGYTTESRDDHFLGGDSHEAGGYTELLIRGNHGSQGYVLFMAYDEAGRALRPPASHHASIARLMGVWKKRIMGGESHDLAGARIFQVQLLSESALPFSDAEKLELRELFHEMRGRIANYVSETHAGRN